MEVLQSEMTQELWDDWAALIRGQECAVCGGQLTIRTVPARAAMALGCTDPEHSGFRQRTSYTEEYRRGAEVYPAIRDNIEAKMMVKTELQRAMNLLALRFPFAIKDVAGAALFINDCMRLGLDPLIQPAEAVPVPFKTRDKSGREKTTVAMVVTEDGALSMAARGCREEYDGAPATMPLLDHLMRENPQRPFEELKEMAMRTAKELCDDPDAYVWVALGKRRSATGIQPVYGYYTTAEHKKARENKLPAGTQPGNQARVRAVKRWVRENFPESRQKMIEYTAELYRRSEGAKEAQKLIDAEYTVFTTPLISPPGGKTGAPPEKTGPPAGKLEENKVAESAKQSRVSNEKPAGAVSGADEDTSVSEQGSPEIAAHGESSAEAPDIEGEGFSIDLTWLKETLEIIKWSEDTAKSWIASNLKVDSSGKLTEVLTRLTREQAERFTHELQERAARVQPELF